MEELRTEEMMETVGTVAEELAESVIEKAGLTLGQKVMVGTGVTVVVIGLGYGIYRLVTKGKKAKENEVSEATVEESNFEETNE